MIVLKEFEKSQLDWWCNYYRVNAEHLAKRARQFLNGEIDKGVLEVMIAAVEKEAETRDKLD